MNRYSLRLYDEELLTFSLESVGLSGMLAHVLNVNESRRNVFPLDLEVTDEGMMEWLKKRVLPRSRANSDAILSTLGLSANNTKGIIDTSKGLSLNDSYWIVPFDFDGVFKDYNLYKNRFSDEIAHIALTGEKRPIESFKVSPELTTQGTLRKAWHNAGGDGIFLYKGGSSNKGREPVNEFLASQIAERMGLHTVHYDLDNWNDIVISKCKLFTGIDISFIPIGRIIKNRNIQACLDYYEEISKEAVEELKSMLVFDAVIYNEDRHFGNFGILRDNHSGIVLGPAPIFDNALSLFNYAMPSDYKNLAEYAKTRSNPYGISYEAICREVMGPKQRNQLRRLIGFHFARNPIVDLPEEHLTAIEKQVDMRIKKLLSLS